MRYRIKGMISSILILGAFGGARADREAIARANVELKIRGYAKAAGVTFPPHQILLRVFKEEMKMEVWGGNSATSELKRLVRYQVLAASGTIGPKRREGDMQVPEGWYSVSQFNPNSAYHLSLGLNYPNASDRHFATAKDPGKDIFIHGNHVSAGCLAMGDPAIEEIYTLARMSKNKVQVLILPAKTLPPAIANPNHQRFWSQLYAIDSAFIQNRVLPSITIDSNGRYTVRQNNL